MIGIWALVAYTGAAPAVGLPNLHNPFFLPSPGTVAKSLYNMFAHEGFAHDVWASTRRIGLGFLISAAIGIPLGIAIGSFRVVQAFFEPIIAAVRYMPASAFIPLLAATSSATIKYVQAQPIPIRMLSRTPGHEAGRSTRQKTCQREAPSV